ncbi:MAG: PQQ-binding-like beta-propeller repeat protein [Candidatus Eisenbacteria bacterium]|nr:PQQ-binding-like beta-propeller repeat protein [Candidatus Eisenbacteria bacterium]
MRRLTRFVAALVAALACTLVALSGLAESVPSAGGSLRVLWRADAGRSIEQPPLVDARAVYVVTTDPRTMAFDRASGEKLWSTRAKQPFSAPPLLAGGRVVVGLGGRAPRVRALECSDGEEAWTVAVSSEPRHLLQDGDGLLVLLHSGELRRLALADGSTLWRRPGLGTRPAGMALGDSVLFVLARKDSVLALAARGGTEVWHAIEPGFYAASPALLGGELALLAGDGREVYLDPASGARLGGARRSPLQLAPPVLSGGFVVSQCTGGRVEAVDRSERATIWSVDLNAAAAGGVVASDGLLFCLSRAGRLAALRADRGGLIWKLDLGTRFFVPPLVRPDLLLLAGERGELIVYARESEGRP